MADHRGHRHSWWEILLVVGVVGLVVWYIASEALAQARCVEDCAARGWEDAWETRYKQHGVCWCVRPDGVVGKP